MAFFKQKHESIIIFNKQRKHRSENNQTSPSIENHKDYFPYWVFKMNDESLDRCRDFG